MASEIKNITVKELTQLFEINRNLSDFEKENGIEPTLKCTLPKRTTVRESVYTALLNCKQRMKSYERKPYKQHQNKDWAERDDPQTVWKRAPLSSNQPTVAAGVVPRTANEVVGERRENPAPPPANPTTVAPGFEMTTSVEADLREGADVVPPSSVKARTANEGVKVVGDPPAVDAPLAATTINPAPPPANPTATVFELPLNTVEGGVEQSKRDDDEEAQDENDYNFPPPPAPIESFGDTDSTVHATLTNENHQDTAAFDASYAPTHNNRSTGDAAPAITQRFQTNPPMRPMYTNNAAMRGAAPPIRPNFFNYATQPINSMYGFWPAPPPNYYQPQIHYLNPQDVQNAYLPQLHQLPYNAANYYGYEPNQQTQNK